jgi:nitroreductase
MSSPTPPAFVPLGFERRSPDELVRRAQEFYSLMQKRRTTRHFSRDPVARELIESAIATAGTAPSGAHQEPWIFVAVSDPELKRRIRAAAEEEERLNYSGRMPPEWLEALAPLGTDRHKPHLTDAPWLVVMFRKLYELREDGSKRPYYYTQESCGIAAGLFICAAHNMGLALLTHTPSPMAFLSDLLERPVNERPFLIMPVGLPAADARVPDIKRKSLGEIAIFR